MGPCPTEVELAQQTNLAANQRSAVGVGFFTPCGEVSTRMISVFVPGFSELYMCGWIPIPACDPIVPG